MRVDLLELLELLSEPYCRNCCGEGYLISVGRSSYFDPIMGNWYPSEETEPCDHCHGTGNYHYPPGRMGSIIERLDQLSPTDKAGLQHLYENEEAVLTGSTYQAIWQLLEDLEIELPAGDPATSELHSLLAACTVTDPPTVTTSSGDQSAPQA